jgi:hypothetical protein
MLISGYPKAAPIQLPVEAQLGLLAAGPLQG